MEKSVFKMNNQKMQDQLKSLYETIRAKIGGYCGTDDLIDDLYDRFQINGDSLAERAGFIRFEDLLGSKEMRNKIEIDTNYEGQTVYRARNDSGIRRTSRRPVNSGQNQEACNDSNQHSYHRNSTFSGLDKDDDFGPAQSDTVLSKNFWDDREKADEGCDKPIKRSSFSNRFSESTNVKDEQDLSRKYTRRCEGEYTESSDEDETPVASKKEVLTKKAPQSLQHESEDVSKQNLFRYLDLPYLERMAKDIKKTTTESSFANYTSPSQIDQNNTYVDSKQRVHAFEPISSAVPPLNQSSNLIGQPETNFLIRRSDSVASLVSNSAARLTLKPLAVEDMVKIGEVVTAIIKYAYPHAVLIDNLILSMEMIEPRFANLEQSTNWSYETFFKQWCKELIVIGKTGKQNLLWKEP